MDADRWQRLCRVFEAARGLRGTAREAVIASSPDLAEEVRELLAQHETDGGVLSDEAADPAIGTTVGTYRLEALLGEGGMARVYRAMGSGETVAIKRLHPALALERRVRERFRREGELGRRIVHPHVVRTREVIEPDTLVMDYVTGRTLRARLEEEGPLSAEDAARVGTEIADALHAIHEAGAIHRDLKPSNVMEDEAGVIRVMDLGIALPLDEMLRLSRTGEFIGTVRYAAPEHLLDSKSTDARVDVYAFGLLLYELLSGRLPHPPAGLVGSMRAHLEREPDPLTDHARHVPASLVTLVHACLEKDPADRPETAATVRDALASFA